MSHLRFGSKLCAIAALLATTTLQVTSVSAAPAPVRTAIAPAADSSGYAWINYFRSLAGLPPVARDPRLEAQDAVHVRYLANSALACETNVHDELTAPTAGCGANPAATAAGKAAANNSDITRVSVDVSDRQAVSNWYGAAFHALTLLDPRLQTTGYAAYYTPAPKGAKPLAWPYTAAADVYRGRTGTYNHSVVAFPANNASTPLLSYQIGTESPEPFREANPSACVGWSAKNTVSSPIIVQWPIASGVPSGAAVVSDLTARVAEPTCALTGSSYPAGSLPAQFLNGANTITKSGFYYSAVPFQAGHRYQLKIGGRVITTFSAVNVPTTPTVAVTHAVKPGAVAARYSNVGSARPLTRVWNGPNCTGTVQNQRWGAKPGTTITGLRPGSRYSIQVAAIAASGSGRWSACVNFRAT